MALKWEGGDSPLSETFRPGELQKLFANFVNLTGIDASLQDPDGNGFISERKDPGHSLCDLLRPLSSPCAFLGRDAGRRAFELREPYIFQCGQAMKCAVALIRDGSHFATLIVGPVFFWNPDDSGRQEILDLGKRAGMAPFTVLSCLDAVPRISPETLRSAAKTLSLLVGRMGFLETREAAFESHPDNLKPLRRGTSPLPMEALGRQSRFRRYSLALERELVSYVQAADLDNAGKIFDDLLAEIFSLSTGNLDLVKVNVYELTATLMRSAVDAGVPLAELSRMTVKANAILADESRFDEVAFLMKEILEGISGAIFQNGFRKPENRNLLAAIRYMKDNYGKELSLSSVAKNVFVSEYYLSHLFREEMGTTFSAFLAKIRMEAAIRLMEEKTLPIRQIAEQTGFRDAGNFAKKFRQYHGTTPKKYMDTL